MVVDLTNFTIRDVVNDSRDMFFGEYSVEFHQNAMKRLVEDYDSFDSRRIHMWKEYLIDN